ncbi:AAA family ATPase [archaeon]|nr:AAA family ATPase [archaeon]
MNKVVIAGGAGAGKTRLINYLGARGYRVVPEVITLLNNEGLNPGNCDSFFDKTFDKQLSLEESIICGADDYVFLDRSSVDLFALCTLSLRKPPLGLVDYVPDFSHVFFINAVFSPGIYLRAAKMHKDDYVSFARRIYHDLELVHEQEGVYDLYILEHDLTRELYSTIASVLAL